MRLIDKDDLLCDMKKCKAFGELSAKSAIRKVETWQTVEAIPIDWINKWVITNNVGAGRTIDRLLEDWEKENDKDSE